VQQPNDHTHPKHDAVARAAEHGLTETQLRVLVVMNEGYSHEQAASMLGIARRTVDTHLQDIYGRLEVQRLQQALHYALEHGLIGPDGIDRHEPPAR
jgi:DNA-binding NarL/FixJ family response regulator